MAKTTQPMLPAETVLHVRDSCLCLATQRAARRLARRFDAVLKPVGLTNGQFSLMVALNQPEPPSMGSLAPLLGMEASTLTAAVKPLARRGLLRASPDPDDGRSRHLIMTSEGAALLNREVALDQRKQVNTCVRWYQSVDVRGVKRLTGRVIVQRRPAASWTNAATPPSMYGNAPSRSWRP